jgi:hypothetical protein
MKGNWIKVWVLGVLLVCGGTADAALTSNRWQVGDGKWEDAANWTQGTPSPTQAINIIASIFPSITTVDTTTVTQHVGNLCMTISNLVVGGLTTHALFLKNANDTPGNIGLTIINQFSITSSGSLSITNSDMKVIGSPFGAAIFNDGTILLNTGTMIVTQGFGDLFVGYQGVGTVTVSNGTLRAGFVYVPWLTGMRGTLNIAGGTNSFVNLNVGFNETGTVWMTGGLLTVSPGTNIVGGSSSGAAEMTVSNGTWTAGVVSIRWGGTLTMAGGTNNLASLQIADFNTSTSAVWMTGGQLSVTNGATLVGNNGVGQMTVSNGIFLARELYVGTNTGSQGTFNVAGGTNSLTSFLHVGERSAATGAVWVTDGLLVITNSPTIVGVSGVAQLTLSNGTFLTSATCVGSNSGSRGALTIAGGTNFVNGGLQVGLGVASTGSVWITGGELVATNSGAEIGVNGVGRLTISNGVYRTQNLIAGLSSAASGTLTFAGGTADLNGIYLGVNASLATGTVWLTGGELLSPGTFVGLNGVGRMNVSNGTWRGGGVFVANNAGSKGDLKIAGGTNLLTGPMWIGSESCASTGIVTVTGGSLYITNASGFGALEVRSGTFTQSGGLVQVDTFVLTNSCAHFTRTGGTLIYSNAVLVASRDDDGDGISNGYEQSHGLDPLNPADANLDNDGDGLSNLQEFLAGTDATNSLSSLRITAIARVATTNILVTWMTGPGKTNALERTAGVGGSFATNNFASITNIITVGTITNFLDPAAATNAPSLYYRVRLVP